MTKSLNAPLSPNEEVTLRRVALGLTERSKLAPEHVRRLLHLALVEDVDGELRLTRDGHERYAALPRPAHILADATRDELNRIVEVFGGRRRA